MRRLGVGARAFHHPNLDPYGTLATYQVTPGRLAVRAAPSRGGKFELHVVAEVAEAPGQPLRGLRLVAVVEMVGAEVTV